MFDFLVPCRLIGSGLGRMAPAAEKTGGGRDLFPAPSLFSGQSSLGFNFDRKKENDYKYL
ncbi:hypothetical protein [Mesorhizobium atlanticum]|uniref:Uncharacterized protein n=1 Tax=Mesorhizobium atlanticum TaxID=2233532 RepID=A0A330GXC2_9HYPH|nr:hypothetical protein [Mesorhizobium atlanticum]RAZ79961.1 hypothetical protein DPM35_01290 [Mesorhizobium atlanticum]